MRAAARASLRHRHRRARHLSHADARIFAALFCIIFYRYRGAAYALASSRRIISRGIPRGLRFYAASSSRQTTRAIFAFCCVVFAAHAIFVRPRVFFRVLFCASCATYALRSCTARISFYRVQRHRARRARFACVATSSARGARTRLSRICYALRFIIFCTAFACGIIAVWLLLFTGHVVPLCKRRAAQRCAFAQLHVAFTFAGALSVCTHIALRVISCTMARHHDVAYAAAAVISSCARPRFTAHRLHRTRVIGAPRAANIVSCEPHRRAHYARLRGFRCCVVRAPHARTLDIILRRLGAASRSRLFDRESYRRTNSALRASGFRNTTRNGISAAYTARCGTADRHRTARRICGCARLLGAAAIFALPWARTGMRVVAIRRSARGIVSIINVIAARRGCLRTHHSSRHQFGKDASLNSGRARASSAARTRAGMNILSGSCAPSLTRTRHLCASLYRTFERAPRRAYRTLRSARGCASRAGIDIYHLCGTRHRSPRRHRLGSASLSRATCLRGASAGSLNIGSPYRAPRVLRAPRCRFYRFLIIAHAPYLRKTSRVFDARR